jgi:hypothetical protein
MKIVGVKLTDVEIRLIDELRTFRGFPTRTSVIVAALTVFFTSQGLKARGASELTAQRVKHKLRKSRSA